MDVNGTQFGGGIQGGKAGDHRGLAPPIPASLSSLEAVNRCVFSWLLVFPGSWLGVQAATVKPCFLSLGPRVDREHLGPRENFQPGLGPR
ncbi:hypothetical protein NHX12_005765, partial [Muraenolepis orangiensis]